MVDGPKPYCGLCGQRNLNIDQTFTRYSVDSGEPYRTGHILVQCPDRGRSGDHTYQWVYWSHLTKAQQDAVVFDEDPAVIKEQLSQEQWQRKKERIAHLVRLFAIAILAIAFAAVILTANYLLLD